jgi:uncharacterized protein YehS (DUF1456 family)
MENENMTNNDILRRVRYALDIPDTKMVEIFALADHKIDRTTVEALLKKEEQNGYIECPDKVLAKFLDGLIIQRRGKQERKPGQSHRTDLPLNNNIILKKLRIALELREDEMLQTLSLGGLEVSKSELTALFRKKGHKHYQLCGDQFLRNFLNGLTRRYRSDIGRRSS